MNRQRSAKSGFKRWWRLLAGLAAVYLLCWVATYAWGAAAVRRTVADRLQTEVNEDRARQLVNPPNNKLQPSYRITDVSVMVPFRVDVTYTVTHGFDDARGGRSRWVWLPGRVWLWDDELTWVT